MFINFPDGRHVGVGYRRPGCLQAQWKSLHSYPDGSVRQVGEPGLANERLKQLGLQKERREYSLYISISLTGTSAPFVRNAGYWSTSYISIDTSSPFYFPILTRLCLARNVPEILHMTIYLSPGIYIAHFYLTNRNLKEASTFYDYVYTCLLYNCL